MKNSNNNNNNAGPATQGQPKPAAGTRVRMISENSNWEIGEMGTVVIDEYADFPESVFIALDGREDDYTAFLDAFEVVGQELPPCLVVKLAND